MRTRITDSIADSFLPLTVAAVRGFFQTKNAAESRSLPPRVQTILT